MAGGDFLVALIPGAVLENDDARVLAGLTLARGQHHRDRVQGVADEHGPRKAHLIPAEIADGRAVGGVVDGQSHEQPERKNTVYDALAERGALGGLRIQMQRGGVHGERAEQEVVGLRDRAPHQMLEALTDREFLEIQSRHDHLLQKQAPSVA